jgi:thioredoxin-like negative regulator of GroEL
MACLRAKPIVDGLEAEWEGQVRVARLNVMERENRALIARLGVRVVPTYVLLDRNGREIWRAVGVINADAARQAVINSQQSTVNSQQSTIDN